MDDDNYLKSYEFVHNHEHNLIGLVVTNANGEDIVVPFTTDAALRVGASLIAQSDFYSGRPVRDWSQLN